MDIEVQGLQHRRPNVMGAWVRWPYQDQVSPMRCANRPNATAAPPGNGAQHRIPCRKRRGASWPFRPDAHRPGARFRIQTVQVLSETETVLMLRPWPDCKGRLQPAGRSRQSMIDPFS